MHEFSLALGLMDELKAVAAVHGATRVMGATVSVGARSGVVIESFRFGCQVLSDEEPLTRGMALEIQTPAPDLLCCGCGAKVAGAGGCPVCGSSEVWPTGGDGIDLIRVELEIPDKNTGSGG